MTQDLYPMDNASSSFTMEFSGRTRKAKVAMLREEFFAQVLRQKVRGILGE